MFGGWAAGREEGGGHPGPGGGSSPVKWLHHVREWGWGRGWGVGGGGGGGGRERGRG